MKQESSLSTITLEDDDPAALDKLIKLFYGINVFSGAEELLARHASSSRPGLLSSRPSFSSASTANGDDKTPESSTSFSEKSLCAIDGLIQISELLSDVVGVYIVADKYDSPSVRSDLLRLFPLLGQRKNEGAPVWGDSMFLESGDLALLLKKIFENLPSSDPLRAKAIEMTRLALPSYVTASRGSQDDEVSRGNWREGKGRETLSQLLDTVPDLAREITLLVAAQESTTASLLPPKLSLSHSPHATLPPSPAAPHKTALHWAAQVGDVHKLERLLNLGMDVDVRDENGERPLHFATWYGQLEAARVLVSNGADVGAASFAFPHGTPLRWACTRGYFKIRELLVGRGAVEG